jgi:hypothetical protein
MVSGISFVQFPVSGHVFKHLMSTVYASCVNILSLKGHFVCQSHQSFVTYYAHFKPTEEV